MSDLKAWPVRRQRQPRYPTKMEVRADPDLLREHVPAGWLTSREIGGALSLLLAANMAGCSGKAGWGGAGAPGGQAAVVAPVFQHGDGHGWGFGAVGCVAVAAPTFLAEEEAIQVIQEELAKAGLKATPQDVKLGDVVIDGHKAAQGYDWTEDALTMGLEAVRGPLEPDLLDTDKRVAIEFVSEKDFFVLGGNVEPGLASGYKELAESVTQKVGRHGRGLYFGAFYDPVTYYGFMRRGGNERWADSPESAKAESKRLLRLQVQDFVEWLKGQGVI